MGGIEVSVRSVIVRGLEMGGTEVGVRSVIVKDWEVGGIEGGARSAVLPGGQFSYTLLLCERLGSGLQCFQVGGIRWN